MYISILTNGYVKIYIYFTVVITVNGSISTTMIVGAAAGGGVLLGLVIGAGVMVCIFKRYTCKL
jgi:hypothetical protein